MNTRSNPSAVHESLTGFKERGQKIAALTAYDYPTARLLDESGVDLILVGDSLGMVVLGYEDTTEVSMEDMVRHTAACRRGVTRAPLAADLPFGSYNSPEDAVTNAQRLTDAGAELVKLEGGTEQIPAVRAIIDAGIPFIGHIGMLPQSVRETGGYRKTGKTEAGATRLLQDAEDLEAAGASAIVLESMVADVAASVTRSVGIPTIGIGAGDETDGQILVLHDLIGAFPWFRPSFAKTYADVAGDIRKAVARYVDEVATPGDSPET